MRALGMRPELRQVALPRLEATKTPGLDLCSKVRILFLVTQMHCEAFAGRACYLSRNESLSTTPHGRECSFWKGAWGQGQGAEAG